MSEQKWTPGPWRRCGGATPHYTAIVGPDNKYIVFCMADPEYDKERGEKIETPSFDEQWANSRRIVACINGCAGIADPSAVGELIEFMRHMRLAMPWHVFGTEAGGGILDSYVFDGQLKITAGELRKYDDLLERLKGGA